MQNKSKKLYVISGSSGVGKSTVIKSFLHKHPDFVFSISCTTRPMRDGEVDGVNYFFITKDQFQKSIDNDEFIEWAEFSGNFYGTKRDFIQQHLDNGHNLILDIDTRGALNIKEDMPEAVLIFISPPSYQDLEYRLRNRKTESDESIQQRLDFVKLEILNSEYFDYMVVNDVVEDTVAEIEKIIINEEMSDAQW